jgi:hypothetical protein
LAIACSLQDNAVVFWRAVGVMPRRTRKWVLAGRATAAAAVAGLGVWLWVVGLNRAAVMAGPVAAVIALAALFAPYLLPVYQPPADPPGLAGPVPGPGGVLIVADHGSVAAQHIGQVMVNTQRPDPGRPGGQAE